MRRKQWATLRRGDVLKIGRLLRVVQLGPGDVERPSPGFPVLFAKVVHHGFDNGSTCYTFHDLGKRATLVKRLSGAAAASVLRADVLRLDSIGYNGRRTAARVRRDELRCHRLGLQKLKSLCVRR